MADKSKLAFAAALVVIVIVAVFLYQSASSTGGKQPLRVIHQTWVGDAPVYLAKEKGFFSKRGLEVEITRVEHASERRALLSTGKADVTLETIDMAIVDVGSGVPLHFFLQLDESAGADGVVASQEIVTLQDLKGKRVGAQKGEVPYMLLRYLMKKENISRDSVEFVDLFPDDAGAAFVSGSIDAAGTWEPWLSKAKQRTGGHILVSSKDAPGVIVDVAAATKTAVSSRSADLNAFSCAWLEAIEYIRAHPQESYAIMAKYYDLTPEEFADMISGLAWNNATEHAEFFGSGQALETTKMLAEIASEDGLTPSQVDASAMANSKLALEIGGGCAS